MTAGRDPHPIESDEAIWNDVTLALATIAKATADQQHGQRTGKLATPEALRGYVDRVRNSLQVVLSAADALEEMYAAEERGGS